MKFKNLEAEIIEQITKNKALIYEIAEFLYHHPEVGFKEFKAVELLTTTLKNAGFKFRKTNPDLVTAFRAEKKGIHGGPTIALVAEYDALPNLGHACGHNLIAAGVVGAALAISTVIAKLKGNIVVIGSPAEENGGGKIIMLKKGAWQGIDMALSFHPAAETIVSPETFCTYAINFSISRNKPSQITIYDIYQHILNGIRGAGFLFQSEIIQGAVSRTISPEKLSAILKLSAQDEQVLDEIISNINLKIAALNNIEGFNVIINEILKYEKLLTDPHLANILKKRMLAMGIPESEINTQSGATDLGNISNVIPCLCPLISLEKNNLPIHTREFALASHPDKAGKTLLLATELLSLTILDLFWAKKS